MLMGRRREGRWMVEIVIQFFPKLGWRGYGWTRAIFRGFFLFGFYTWTSDLIIQRLCLGFFRIIFI